MANCIKPDIKVALDRNTLDSANKDLLKMRNNYLADKEAIKDNPLIANSEMNEKFGLLSKQYIEKAEQLQQKTVKTLVNKLDYNIARAKGWEQYVEEQKNSSHTPTTNELLQQNTTMMVVSGLLQHGSPNDLINFLDNTNDDKIINFIDTIAKNKTGNDWLGVKAKISSIKNKPKQSQQLENLKNSTKANYMSSKHVMPTNGPDIDIHKMFNYTETQLAKFVKR